MIQQLLSGEVNALWLKWSMKMFYSMVILNSTKFSNIFCPWNSKEESWPGVTHLPQFWLDFPFSQSKNLSENLHTKDSRFVDLIVHCLILNPKQRISAFRAFQHPLFDCISPNLLISRHPKGINRWLTIKWTQLNQKEDLLYPVNFWSPTVRWKIVYPHFQL
jgi:serine/threonine protein kinase